MDDFYEPYYNREIDNKKVYLQEGQDAPQGVTLHRGIRKPTARWYDPDEKAKPKSALTVSRYVTSDQMKFLKAMAAGQLNDTRGIITTFGKVSTYDEARDSLLNAGLLTYGKNYEPMLTDDGKEAATSDKPNIITLKRIGIENELNANPIKSRKLDPDQMKVLQWFSTIKSDDQMFKDVAYMEKQGQPYMNILNNLKWKLGVIENKPGNNPRYVLTPHGEEALKTGMVPLPSKIVSSIQDPVSTTGRPEYETASLQAYKNDDFDPVNKALMDGIFPERESHKQSIEDIVCHLDNLIGRSSLDSDVTVYNGCPKNVANMLIQGGVHDGDIFQLDTFTSTSLSKPRAATFTNTISTPDGEKKVLLSIDQKEGMPCYYFGVNDSEKEVLLPRGTQVRLKGITKESIADVEYTVVNCERV